MRTNRVNIRWARVSVFDRWKLGSSRFPVLGEKLFSDCAWMAFAAMGWRAAVNRQFSSHSQWMIRSYVLVWSFVFCRIASRVSDVDELGGGEAFIWLSWVLPLILAEIVLQWHEGSRKQPARQSTNH